MNKDAIIGCLLGTAVGDAIGLPREGLSSRRAARLYGDPISHRFILGRGMVSDDTDLTLFVAQSLTESPDDPVLFQRRLARRFRWWLMGMPAGVGFATLKSILNRNFARPWKQPVIQLCDMSPFRNF